MPAERISTRLGTSPHHVHCAHWNASLKGLLQSRLKCWRGLHVRRPPIAFRPNTAKPARAIRPPPRLCHGFERHAANRAEAGLRPNDLRMHRTSPQRLTGISRCYCRLVVDVIGRDVASRLGDKAVPGIWRRHPRQVDGALHARCPPVACRAKYREAGNTSLMQINRRPVSNGDQRSRF
jgi:hypothetical protein